MELMDPKMAFRPCPWDGVMAEVPELPRRLRQAQKDRKLCLHPQDPGPGQWGLNRVLSTGINRAMLEWPQ